MTSYWRSPDLTFFSEGKEQDGWDATIERYLAKYARPGHEMGKWILRPARRSAERGLGLRARPWKLTMSDAKTPHGLFTLVFRKFPEGWKIVHDHTSAAE